MPPSTHRLIDHHHPLTPHPPPPLCVSVTLNVNEGTFVFIENPSSSPGGRLTLNWTELSHDSPACLRVCPFEWTEQKKSTCTVQWRTVSGRSLSLSRLSWDCCSAWPFLNATQTHIANTDDYTRLVGGQFFNFCFCFCPATGSSSFIIRSKYYYRFCCCCMTNTTYYVGVLRPLRCLCVVFVLPNIMQ